MWILPYYLGKLVGVLPNLFLQPAAFMLSFYSLARPQQVGWSHIARVREAVDHDDEVYNGGLCVLLRHLDVPPSTDSTFFMPWILADLDAVLRRAVVPVVRDLCGG